jgi:hypothetical protein
MEKEKAYWLQKLAGKLTVTGPSLTRREGKTSINGFNDPEKLTAVFK